MPRALMGSCRATNGGAIPISSSLPTSSPSSFSDTPILLLQRWRRKLFLSQFHPTAAPRHPARFHEKTQNWAHPLSALCILRAGFFSFAAKTSSWSADQSPYDVLGVAINEDGVHNQISMKLSSELGSDDLWSSLSSFMDDEGREPLGASAASKSLMGLSTSLFNDVNSFVMDKEDPAEYVPAPAISAADLELNTQLENVLYVLREVLPGPMVKTGMDNKLLEAWSFVRDDIKVQDPIVCLKGKDRLWSWLHTLATTNAQVHLNEIYAEWSRAHPFKGFIHAVWTLVFPEELQPTLKHPTSRSSTCVERSLLQLNFSGESKFEVDRTGQVISIESNWYVTKEREEELDSIKLLLTSLLLKEAHN